MNTNLANNIPYFDEMVRWSDGLMNAPAAVLVFLLCICAGYMWKIIRVFPTRFTPLVVMLTGALLLMLFSWLKEAEAELMLRNFLVGFIVGFAAWMLHKLVIKRVENKLGLFGADDTEFLNKPTDKKQP